MSAWQALAQLGQDVFNWYQTRDNRAFSARYNSAEAQDRDWETN